MLISYPVLPAAAIHDDEDVYLANIIEGHLLQYEGVYPVSTINTAQGPMHRWHGGVHLSGGGEPIRAIADGTVVACRFAAQAETYEPLGSYDTSFVLLRHETQTGENTTVVFYSLYMHLANQSALAADRLSQLPAWMRQNPSTEVKRPPNQRVWRKDVLGFAGQLYNREAMHFEVFMLDADFQRVWRDSTAITQGTGSDDWFGDAHFVIPAGSQFVERHPDAPTDQGIKIVDLAGNQHDVYFPAPRGSSGQNDQPLYVSVSLQRGRRVATTYRSDGNGGYEPVGAPIVEEDYEYELHRLTKVLYPDSPSAGLEWLRFGRLLGADTTIRHQNWQQVRYSDSAIGYIDLAIDTVAKLSDADFPHWLGWEKREEGETTNFTDGICDDQRTLDVLHQAQGNEAAARKLQHLVCKSPSEWDDSDLPVRYARLRETGQSLESEDSWQRFSEHVRKLAFWSQAELNERSIWHFHPLRFIHHFRKCAWLTGDELSLAIPRYPIYQQSNGIFSAHTNGPPSVYQITRHEARLRFSTYFTELNRTIRKYAIHGGARRAIFIAQVIHETDRWRTVREYGLGQPNPAIPMAQYYAAFYGRGIMQLTWVGMYRDYANFRGDTALPHHNGPYSDPRITAQSVHWTGAPTETGSAQIRWAPRFDPGQLVSDPYLACDSGGFFWVSKMIGGRRYNINQVCDRGANSEAVGRASVLVNGGGNGYLERQAYAQYLFRYLMDDTSRSNPQTFSTPRGNISVNFDRPND
ncbi:M23 family metallopeptidase [Ideonella sp. DXS29W]|uniref:M23 family metallopeptidase n=1 Tax=Ideonella lacteola TaxID=2984193 RepID=A0ABU9BZV5_9BURK